MRFDAGNSRLQPVDWNTRLLVNWEVFYIPPPGKTIGLTQLSGTVRRLDRGPYYIVRLWALLEKGCCLFSQHQPSGKEGYATRIELAGNSGVVMEGTSFESALTRTREDGVVLLEPLLVNKVCFVQTVGLTFPVNKVRGTIGFRICSPDGDSEMQECCFSLSVCQDIG